MKSYDLPSHPTSKRYTVEAFDFETAKQSYTDDVTTKTAEKEAKANAKAEKIAKDKAIREAKKKANVEANATEKAE